MNLPAEFLKRMESMLGEEYEAFRGCYTKPYFQGVRLNPLKCDVETLRVSLPFPIEKAPFSEFSFYGPGKKVGRLPAHHAGMFYSQEPSAASAVTVLNPKPGERVLDLCAAPGGKSTQIAGFMEGKGLLWANEIVRGRANVLLSNMERTGVKNGVVSSCRPEVLCQQLKGYFDKVLVDAPCSGEGLFRREPEAVQEWSPEHVVSCARRQRAILDCAASALREGGILVYSTCTFSIEENEETVEAFLKAHPEFQMCPVESDFGRPAFGMPAKRIFPMDGGEGHFVAKLQKTGGEACKVKEFSSWAGKQEQALAQELYESLFYGPCPQRLARFGEKLSFLPEGTPRFSGLCILRAGVELGEIRGKRVEPSHALFQSSSKRLCRNTLNFSPEAPELSAFLRGEEIDCGGKGYTAVCVAGVPLGFGKASEGRLKNRYPKGLRNLE